MPATPARVGARVASPLWCPSWFSGSLQRPVLGPLTAPEAVGLFARQRECVCHDCWAEGLPSEPPGPGPACLRPHHLCSPSQVLAPGRRLCVFPGQKDEECGCPVPVAGSPRSQCRCGGFLLRPPPPASLLGRRLWRLDSGKHHQLWPLPMASPCECVSPIIQLHWTPVLLDGDPAPAGQPQLHQVQPQTPCFQTGHTPSCWGFGLQHKFGGTSSAPGGGLEVGVGSWKSRGASVQAPPLHEAPYLSSAPAPCTHCALSSRAGGSRLAGPSLLRSPHAGRVAAPRGPSRSGPPAPGVLLLLQHPSWPPWSPGAPAPAAQPLVCGVSAAALGGLGAGAGEGLRPRPAGQGPWLSAPATRGAVGSGLGLLAAGIRLLASL